mgnify:CR=1 FL=1
MIYALITGMLKISTRELESREMMLSSFRSGWSVDDDADADDDADDTYKLYNINIVLVSSCM